MKVKCSTILKWLIELMIIMKLGFVKLLGSLIPIFASPYDTYPECILYLLLTIICVLFAFFIYREKASIYLRIELVVALVTIFCGIIHALNWNNMGFMDVLSSAMPYFYLMLSYPAYVLIKRKYWDIEDFFNFIIFWGTIAYFLKIVNCVSWLFTGKVIWQNLISNSNWILNNSLRINPPFVGLLIIPISYYKMSSEAKIRKKIKYLIPIVVSIAYSAFVHQARSIFLYQIITLVTMYIFEHVTNRKKIVRYIVLIIAVVIVINTSYFENYINSFSPDNSVSGESTIARFNAIATFGNMYIKHPFWGMGFIEESKKNVGSVGAGLGHLDDIGVLGSFFTLGIPLLLLMILILGRILYLIYKMQEIHKGYSLLLIGMAVLLIMTGINISWFNGIYAFGIPFYICILEYSRYHIKQSRDT